MKDFPRIKEEIEDLKNILKRGNLTEKGIELLKEYEYVLSEVKNLALCAVGKCKTKPKLLKLENELGKLEKIHGTITRRFDIHKSCDSFKFKDGSVYRVKIEKSLNKAVLD